MRTPDKPQTLIAGVIAISLLVGCVRSLHPIYTKSDVIFREDLIGTWKQADQETTWQFTESMEDDRDRAYRLVLTDDKARSGVFLAHLVKLNDALFLDLYPVAPREESSDFYKFHFQRVHTFLRLELRGENLLLAMMNPYWLEQHLRDHPDAISHTMVTPLGHPPTSDDDNAFERLMLTASTDQLQGFLRKHADDEHAF